MIDLSTYSLNSLLNTALQWYGYSTATGASKITVHNVYVLWGDFLETSRFYLMREKVE